MRITADIIDQDILADSNACFENLETRHHFVIYTYTITNPTFCDYCKHLLHGTKRQGLKCNVCNITIHKQCQPYFDKPCICDPMERRGRLELRMEVISDKLVCEVRQAKNLIPMYPNGLPHPYVKLTLIAENGKSREKKTKTVKACFNPQWMETIALDLMPKDINQRLLVEVWHWDEMSQNNFMGAASFEVSEIIEEPVDSWFNLFSEEEHKLYNSFALPELSATVEPQNKFKITSDQLPQEVIEQLEADLKRYTEKSDAYANAARSPVVDFSFWSTQNERFVDMCSKFRNLNISEESDGLIKTCKELTEHVDLVLNRNKTMEEPKVGSSKGKAEMETPSPQMMEFLSKMKQEIKEEIIEELTHLPRIEMQGQVIQGGKMDENQYQGEVIHPGIFCDNCDQLIHGIRYKCGNCADFDLCQECESLPNIHNKNHIFLKIRFPVSLKLFQKQKWQPFILPNAGDLLASNIKSYSSSKKLYEAKFVCDETVPDGTVLSPSTRFIKSWRVLNSGKRVWTHSTKLQHIQGSVGLTPACEQVDVPHLRPGEEGIVSVLFTTPAVSGVYRSHWNFCHKSRPFGHIVWCHIVVKDPESGGKQAEVAPAGFNLTVNGMPSEKEEEVASIAKVLTAVKEEHEKGNMIPRKLAVNSHTTTPNNTPFDLTPPKSPDHQAMNELKVVMEDKESLSAVSVVEYDVDDEGGSVVSLSSSDSDAEFVVIPMPNCFNLSESFASRSISHLSVYMQSDNEKDQKASGQKPTKPNKPVFKAETVSQETGVPELSERRPSQSEEKNIPQKIHISHNASADGSSSEISIIESGENSPTGESPMPEISSIHIAINNGTEPKSSDISASEARRNSLSHDGPEKEIQISDIPATSATFPKFPVEGITSIYESASHTSPEVERTVQVLPEKIVTVPLSVASSVYNATMQVMTNLRRQYSDAQSNQEGASGTTSNTFSKVDQLVEMGFSNRNQNEELLKKHKNDIALVVAELVNMNDNDWYNSRHVPSAPSHN